MNDFFTPVEVQAVDFNIPDPYSIQKYQNDPFMPCTVKIQSLGDFRKKIIQWLANAPVSSRINKLTFTNKEFTCLLMAMHQKCIQHSRQYLRQYAISYANQEGFKIIQERINLKPNPEILAAEQKLINSIMIVNRYSRYDSITINKELATDVNYLFELFDRIQNGVSNEVAQSQCQFLAKQQNTSLVFHRPLDEDPSITKTLGLWLVQVLKKNLCLQYFQEMKRKTDEMEEDLSQQKEKQKQKQFNNFWQNKTKQERERLIWKSFQKDIRTIIYEYRSLINVSRTSFPHIKYCQQDVISLFVQQLVEDAGQYLFRKLKYTHLEHACYDFVLLKYEVLVDIEEEIEIQEKKKERNLQAKKKKKKKELIIKLPAPSNRGSKKEREEKEPIHSIITQQEKNQSSNLNMKQSKSNQQRSKNRINGQNKNKKQQNQKSIKSKKKNGKQQSQSKSSDKSETTDDQQDAIIVNDAGKDPQTIQHMEKTQKDFKQKQRILQLEKQFEKINKQFEDKCKKWVKYQQTAINRISTVFGAYSLSFQVFGSFSTGISIPSSDIDICVNPTILNYFYTSFCSSKQKVVMALRFLESCFSQMTWASNFNLISSASVPVLAFEVDLSIPYGNPKDNNLNLSKLSKSPKICVDITIDSYSNSENEYTSHLGYESTVLVKQWLDQFQKLGDLLKLVKHLLGKKKFNKSFGGGLSSYTLTSIAYAFMKADQNRRKLSLFQLLLQFAQFISQFNETRRIIKLNSEKLFDYFEEKQHQSQKLVVENYLNGKNLAENSFKFKQIKEFFRQLSHDLKNAQGQSLKQYYKKVKNYVLL